MSTSYLMNLVQLQSTANDAAGILLQALEREGLLTRPAVEIASEYAIVFVEKGTIGSAWDAVLKLITGKESAKYIIVRRVPCSALPLPSKALPSSVSSPPDSP